MKTTRIINGVEIDKSVIIPTRNGHIAQGDHDKYKEVLANLEIGESFLIPRTQNYRMMLFSIARKLNVKITTRRVSENFFRVWRI